MDFGCGIRGNMYDTVIDCVDWRRLVVWSGLFTCDDLPWYE